VTRQRPSAGGEPVDLLLETVRLRAKVDIAALSQRWARLNPAGLAALAEYEGCVLWLHRRLKELDLLDLVPADFAQRLSSRARLLAARNLLVDSQRDDLVRKLNEWRVPHVVLKGAARRLVCDVYPYADARRTTDVDVLLPREVARPTWLRLQTEGFVAAPDNGGRYNSHFHLPPLRNGKPVTVELHTSTSRSLPAPLAWSRLESSGQAVLCEGGPTLVPSATELLWHAITHAPLPHPSAFRIRFLQDAAVVWAAGAEVDWSEIGARLSSGELPHGDLARCWLGTAARLTGLTDTHRTLGPLPALDLPRAWRWRLNVFRAGADRGNRDPRLVWGPHLLTRLRRLLIDEGTRAELGLPSAPPPHATSVHWLARRAAAGAARLCYRAWRSFARP
jgi:hypothetical protein